MTGRPVVLRAARAQVALAPMAHSMDSSRIADDMYLEERK